MMIQGMILMKEIAPGLWENDRPDIKCDECGLFPMKYQYNKADGTDLCLCANHGMQVLKNINRYGDHNSTSVMLENQNTERNGNMGKQIGLVVSLPKGVKETNFADSIGRLLPKKGQSGSVITTKNGEPVYQLALDLTNLKAMIEKHKLKAVDKRSGHDIVWVTGFVRDVVVKKTEGTSF